MATDVFVRVFSSNELRLGFAIASVARWKMQKDVNLHVLHWYKNLYYEFECFTEFIDNHESMPFAAGSLKRAEELANSNPYIIANDDTLIYGQDFVENGLRVMRENPDYGVISAAAVNSDQYKFDGPDIFEIHAVGGLVFLRKGLVTEFPPLEDAYWDCERDRQVKAKGFRSGYTKHCPYLNMGANFSVANPAFWTGA